MLTSKSEPRSTPDAARYRVPGAVVVHCRLPAWEAGDSVSQSGTSSIGFSFTRQSCVVELNGRMIAREIHASSVVVVGSQPATWLRVEQPSELIEISGASELRRDLAEGLSVPNAVELDDVEHPGDPVTWGLAARLRVLVRNNKPSDALEVEALVRRFYSYILIASFGGRMRERGCGHLDVRRLARTAEYIDANLGTPLSLGVLADIAALSPFHFQRSFRRSTGCTPHAYVAMRKAERARQQLARGVAAHEVASTMGYSSPRRLHRALDIG